MRKEAKESRYWLNLISCKDSQQNERIRLANESTELKKIFGAIIEKTLNPKS